MPLEKFQWATLHDLVSVSAHYGKVDTGMRVCQELCLIITLGKSTLIEGPPHPLLSRSTPGRGLLVANFCCGSICGFWAKIIRIGHGFALTQGPPGCLVRRRGWSRVCLADGPIAELAKGAALLRCPATCDSTCEKCEVNTGICAKMSQRRSIAVQARFLMVLCEG